VASNQTEYRHWNKTRYVHTYTSKLRVKLIVIKKLQTYDDTTDVMILQPVDGLEE